MCSFNARSEEQSWPLPLVDVYEVSPATTMVEVKRLIDPDMLVEIEADAIISQG
jgi:enamine deaminase RidA (YjgF/YER057c/UK114 family)